VSTRNSDSAYSARSVGRRVFTLSRFKPGRRSRNRCRPGEVRRARRRDSRTLERPVVCDAFGIVRSMSASSGDLSLRFRRQVRWEESWIAPFGCHCTSRVRSRHGISRQMSVREPLFRDT